MVYTVLIILGLNIDMTTTLPHYLIHSRYTILSRLEQHFQNNDRIEIVRKQVERARQNNERLEDLQQNMKILKR